MNQWMLAAVLMVFCTPAFSTGQIASLEIVDSASGRVSPVHYNDGRYFVAGTPGREYWIRLRNQTHGDLLAVVSVDGVNVVTGETASHDQGGYVLGQHRRFDIKGWRKSLDQVASFYFSHIDASYAAQTGRPENVGVIGVALFKRKAYPTDFEERSEADKSGRMRSPAAPSQSGQSAGEQESFSQDAAEPALGTGHGRKQSSHVRYAQFERATETPIETISIYYDSRANLIARGVIPVPRRHPDPFPMVFVPDPPNG